MKTIHKLLGTAPTSRGDNRYAPSSLAMKLSVKRTTDYKPVRYKNRNENQNRKILVIGTEEGLLPMQNGKQFETGNHPVELFVPLLHWEQAGFGFDFATPTGKPLQLEHWAMPEEDEDVMRIYRQNKAQLARPLDLRDVVESGLFEDSPYLGVFIPGGHGAILGLPQNTDVKRVIEWALAEDKYLVSICHGPAALLAASMQEPQENFPLKGYQLAAFPDSMDKLLPALGYLPGKMPWLFGEKLKERGMKIVNSTASGKVCQDRKLLTGDSPMAANKLGKLTAEVFLQEINAK